MTDTTHDEFKEEVFYFLDKLRESGYPNMFGTTLAIADVFGVDAQTARALLVEWMKTFGERHHVP